MANEEHLAKLREGVEARKVGSRLAADFKGWEVERGKFEREFERVVRALQTQGGREEPPEGKL